MTDTTVPEGKIERKRRITLDPYDKAILALLETDNKLTNDQIAEAVNLSASSVRRRVTNLAETGVIEGNVVITDPAIFGLTFVALVRIGDNQPGVASAFESRMAQEPAVSQCYAISGERDYLIIVHATDPEAYQEWGERVLVAMPEVSRYDTSLVWRRTKFTARIEPAE